MPSKRGVFGPICNADGRMYRKVLFRDDYGEAAGDGGLDVGE